MHKLEELIALVLERANEGASFREVLPRLAELRPADAVIVLIKALSKHPELILARLELARLLWQLDCAPFALQQLQEIEKSVASEGSAALKSLIERLGGSPKDGSQQTESPGEHKTLATMDFDIEILENDK